MIVPPAFVDDGHDGTWAEALLHSPFLKVSDYAPCQLTEPDGAVVTVPRREVADASLLIAHPARVVVPPHSQPDSPEVPRNGH